MGGSDGVVDWSDIDKYLTAQLSNVRLGAALAPLLGGVGRVGGPLAPEYDYEFNQSILFFSLAG